MRRESAKLESRTFANACESAKLESIANASRICAYVCKIVANMCRMRVVVMSRHPSRQHQSASVGAHACRGAALSRDARREDHRRRSVHREGSFIDVELQLFRRRCRDGVVEMVNLSAHHSTATDEGSQRDRCALAALPKHRR